MATKRHPLDSDSLNRAKWILGELETAAEQKRQIEGRLEPLRDELKKIQEICSHPRLPERALGEQYTDWCPDCGFMSYCYMM